MSLRLLDLLYSPPIWVPDGMPAQAGVWTEARWKEYFSRFAQDLPKMVPQGRPPRGGTRWDKIPRLQQVRAWLFYPDERMSTWPWHRLSAAQAGWVLSAFAALQALAQELALGPQLLHGLPQSLEGCANDMVDVPREEFLGMLQGLDSLRESSPLIAAAVRALQDFVRVTSTHDPQELEQDQQAVLWLGMLAALDVTRMPEIALWASQHRAQAFAAAFPSWPELAGFVRSYREVCPLHIQTLVQAVGMLSARETADHQPGTRKELGPMFAQVHPSVYDNEGALLHFAQAGGKALACAAQFAQEAVEASQLRDLKHCWDQEVAGIVQGRTHVLAVVRDTHDALRRSYDGFLQGRYTLGEQALRWKAWALDIAKACQELHVQWDRADARVQELGKNPRDNVARLAEATRELLAFEDLEHPLAQEIRLKLWDAAPLQEASRGACSAQDGDAALAQPAASIDAHDTQNLRHDLQAVQGQNAALEDKLREAGSRIQALSAQCEALQAVQGVGSFEPTSAVIERLRSPEMSAVEALLCATAARPALQLAPSAWKSARKAVSFRKVPELFELLLLLGGEYAQALASGKPDAQARQILGQNYRAGESDTTLATKAYREARTFRVGEEDLLMAAHLAIGAAHNVSETIRVHFVWKDGRIIVGYVGEHLPVSSA